MTKLNKIIKTDAIVDMSSIVAFFISKYETSLLENKKTFSEKIAALTAYLDKDFISEVEKDVKMESYNVTIPVLEVTTKASIYIDSAVLQRTKKVRINVNLSDTPHNNGHLSYQKDIVVSDTIHQKFIDTTDEITKLRNSLREVLENLSSISRKERELRGALAEKTLREAGAGDLFLDQTLLDLVSIPTLSMK